MQSSEETKPKIFIASSASQYRLHPGGEIRRERERTDFDRYNSYPYRILNLIIKSLMPPTTAFGHVAPPGRGAEAVSDDIASALWVKPTIQIHNCRLTFLNQFLRKKQRKFDLEIYRKPTDTKRIIPSTSHHTHQLKVSCFKHIIYLILTFAISSDGVMKGTEYTLVVRLNGWTDLTSAPWPDNERRHFNENLVKLTKSVQSRNSV